MKIEEPSRNALAQAGLITNEAGRVVKPSCGILELSWLLDVGKEERRLARERFSRKREVTREERYGWFIASTEAEFKGLEYLQRADWRRALAVWRGESLNNTHNRATLHRALFYSAGTERRDAHLRECLRLYTSLAADSEIYRRLQSDLLDHLKISIRDTYTAGDEGSCAKSLRVLAQVAGRQAVEQVQEDLFRTELDRLRVQGARLHKELLGFQGLAHAPPESLLESCEQALSQIIIPQAARFSHLLLEGSRERNEVEQLVAQACGILSQSFAKAEQPRAAKRWMGEALRWEPSALGDWRVSPEEEWGDEEAAVVRFPKKAEEREEAPLSRGTPLMGIRSRPVRQTVGEAREEHLESVFLALLPVFPVRRFAAYRNLESGEIGYYLRIPLTAWDHFRQGMVVLLLSFALTLAAVSVADRVPAPGDEPGVTVEEVTAQIDGVLEQLKTLAQEEAKLSGLESPTPEQSARLTAIRTQRIDLIQKLERLEQLKNR